MCERRYRFTLHVVTTLTVLLAICFGSATVRAESIGWEYTEVAEVDEPTSFEAVDLDGDGDLDVLTVAEDENSVQWVENIDGQGTEWVEHVIDGDIAFPRWVTAADMDGDGDPDAVGSSYNADKVYWWENDPKTGGPWERRVIGTNFNGAWFVEAGDIDGDGDLDVIGVRTLLGGALVWWENVDGAGEVWSQHPISQDLESPRVIQALDLDDDEDLDVLVAGFGRQEVVWWENTTGDGAAWGNHVIGSLAGVEDLEGADLDADGDFDVVTASSSLSEDALIWWENVNGNASVWEAHTIMGPSQDHTDAVYSSDIDGDGDLDIVSSSGEAKWWENSAGDATSWIERFVGLSAHAIARGDVDGDGHADVLAGGNSSLFWWKSVLCQTLTTDHVGGGIDPTAIPLADGTFVENQIIDDTFTGVTDAAAGDLDGDGDLDVAGVARTGGGVHWVENVSSDATVWTKHFIATGLVDPSGVSIGDFDGDLDADLLGTIDGENRILWWENRAGDGSIWTEHSVANDLTGIRGAASADLDGDGDLDVLTAADESIAWWENGDGGRTWTEHSVDGAFSGANSVVGKDLDGDGDLDLLAAADLDDEVAWWENELGDGSRWTRRTIALGFAGATSAIASDIDRDGDLDVVASAETTGAVSWFENLDGTGVHWSIRYIVGGRSIDRQPGIGAHAILAADLDHDGDLDVVAAGESPLVSWWENPGGEEVVWKPRLFQKAYFALESIALADFDADGDLDLLGATSVVDEIIWWKNTYTALCGLGDYRPGDEIALIAEPDPGWQVESWSGTDDDASHELENLVTMPGNDHTVTVTYSSSVLALEIAGVCPGQVSMRVPRVNEDFRIALFVGEREGVSVVPAGQLCTDAPLSLHEPSLVTLVESNRANDHGVDRVLSLDMCGKYLQAVDLATCRPTEAIQISPRR